MDVGSDLESHCIAQQHEDACTEQHIVKFLCWDVLTMLSAILSAYDTVHMMTPPGA